MNGPLESAITTIVSIAIGGALTHLVGSMVSEPDRVTLAQALTTIALTAGGAVIGWWKARQRTQTSMIKQINDANNGVKVVPENASAARVEKPLRGPGS